MAEQNEKTQEEQQVSRIVIEFMAPGAADVKKAEFENISLGQMLAFSSYAEWRAREAIAQFKAMQQQKLGIEVPRVVLPKGRIQ